jgi:hypothetical protein
MTIVLHLVIRLLRNQRGTLTLETILFFPLLICLLLFIIQVIFVIHLRVNLQSLNSEVVREISSNWSITSLVKRKLPSQLYTLLENKYGNLIVRKTVSVQPLLVHFTEKPLLINHIESKILQIPSRTSNTLSIQLSYPYKFRLPFITRTIRVKTVATEKVWER